MLVCICCHVCVYYCCDRGSAFRGRCLSQTCIIITCSSNTEVKPNSPLQRFYGVSPTKIEVATGDSNPSDIHLFIAKSVLYHNTFTIKIHIISNIRIENDLQDTFLKTSLFFPHKTLCHIECLHWTISSSLHIVLLILVSRSNWHMALDGK